MFGNCCGGSKQDKKLSFNYETAVKEREKSSYEITMSTIVSDRGALSQKCQFHPPIVSNINFFPGINVECYQIKKINNQKIILLYIKNVAKQVKDSNVLLLYSHNNKEDLGTVFPFLVDLSVQLKSDVVSYDYSGYGQSEGKPSLDEVNTDIEQVMDYCVNNLGYEIENTVLIGKTFGVFPTLYLAGLSKYVSVKGMILIEASIGKSVVVKGSATNMILSMAKETMSPALLAHGKYNSYIPCQESQHISKMFRRGITWFPIKADDNIVEEYRSKFYRKVSMFLSHLIVQRNKKVHHELDITHESETENTYLDFDKNQMVFKPSLGSL